LVGCARRARGSICAGTLSFHFTSSILCHKRCSIIRHKTPSITTPVIIKSFATKRLSITTPVIINIEQNASASQQIIVFRCQSAVPEGAPHQQPFPEFAPRNYEEHCTGRPSRQDCAIGRHARQGQTFQDCAIGRHARQEQTSGSVPRQARQGQTFGSAPRQFQSHGSSSRQGHGSSLRQDRTGPGCEWRRLITRGPG
jgi:hypothetical protein